MAKQYRITTRSGKYRVEKLNLETDSEWLPISGTFDSLERAQEIMALLIESDEQWTPVELAVRS